VKNIITTFITWIEAGLAKLKVDLEAIGSALWPAIEAAFTAAEQAEINALIPIAENVVTGINNSTDPKQLFADALAGLETSLVASGKTFVLTLATQAVTLAIDNLKGNTGNGNEGVLSAGNSGPQ
jgi:hypothetical protein